MQRKSVRRPSNDMPGARDVSKIDATRSFAIYGRSGTGKTTLLSTFPGPIILLDIKDKGTDSIADVKGVQVREIESLDDLEDAYQWLKENPERYSTVGIDTVTQLNQLVIREVIGEKGRKGKNAGDWGSMTQQDWGKVSAELKKWITDYRDLTEDGMQVGFLVQERMFNLTDDDDRLDDQIRPEVGPAVPPAVRTHLNASVSVIAHTHIASKWSVKEVRGKKKDVEKLEFRLHLGPNSFYDSKVRKPRGIEAPGYIVDPTYDDIMEVIKGEK